jgi:hypothetical protein
MNSAMPGSSAAAAVEQLDEVLLLRHLRDRRDRSLHRCLRVRCCDGDGELLGLRRVVFAQLRDALIEQRAVAGLVRLLDRGDDLVGVLVEVVADGLRVEAAAAAPASARLLRGARRPRSRGGR